MRYKASVLGSFQKTLQPLELVRLSGREGLSQLFHYDVDLRSTDAAFPFEKVLGQHMTITLEGPSKPRHFHGLVASFTRISTGRDKSSYRAVLRPDMWKSTLQTDSRVFNGTNVMAVVRKVLERYGLSPEELHLQDPLPVWDYVVQYRESDFNFISRLLEHEGIHYWFTHHEDRHTFSLSDSVNGHKTNPGAAAIPIEHGLALSPSAGGLIWDWVETQNVLTDTYSLRDFDYMKPRDAQQAAATTDIDRKHVRSNPALEVYEYPEPIVDQLDYTRESFEAYARRRIEALHQDFEIVQASTNVLLLGTGDVFAPVSGMFAAPIDHLVTSSSHHVEVENDPEMPVAVGYNYSCGFHAMKAKHPVRPRRVARKPVVEGPQTATVVGHAGEVVTTNAQGCVKVQFHWDRDGQMDENSSCWIRVAQMWAGSHWGSLHMPHVGDEVIVSFLEGDPDRPIVTGRVYNGMNKPALELPRLAEHSVIRDHAGNEMLFDPTPGNESITFYCRNGKSRLKLGGGSVEKTTTNKKVAVHGASVSMTYGTKLSFTEGFKLDIDAGAWASFKRGAGASIMLGTDVALVGGLKVALALGGEIKATKGFSLTTGTVRDIKFTKGEYKRRSSNDVVLDSKKKVVLAAGPKDTSLFRLNEREVCLSFDESCAGRESEIAAAEKSIKAMMRMGAAAMGSLSLLEAGTHIYDGVKTAGTVDQHKSDLTPTKFFMGALESANLGDLALAGTIVAPFMTMSKVAKLSFAAPEHKSPSAEVKLKKGTIQILVNKQDSRIQMRKDVRISAKDDLIAKSDKKVELSGTKVVANRNLVVLK